MWGYWSTDGLGLYEYMLLAEELGAEPVWVVQNGIAHNDQAWQRHTPAPPGSRGACCGLGRSLTMLRFNPDRAPGGLYPSLPPSLSAPLV